MDQVEEIKSKTDIVSVVAERVNLKKAGSNFKGLCPFHNEKSPSFIVSPELQIFKCFGCQKSGDVFTFLEEYEGMDFYEALKNLAEKAGITLKESSGFKRDLKDRLYEVNSVVSKFYHYILTKHEVGKHALKYLLESRKISLSSIESFRLGFSPDIPLALKSYVIDKKKISQKELVDVGVVYSASGRSFDRFRGRVIFPLLDHRGNVVGFAGRIMPNQNKKELAKYINSPETQIYKKSQVLFGLFEARSEIKKAGYAVVVEGELDMISCFQSGIKNVIAIKGSALTEEQSRLLSRFTKTLVLALDSDFAGNEAARRGIFIAEKEGLQVRVAEIKDFKDPDEAAQQNPEKLKEYIKNAVGVWDFMINFAFSKHKEIGGEEKEAIAKELIPLLGQIENQITKSHYASILARRLGVPEDAVFGELKKVKTGNKTRLFNKKPVENKSKTRRELLEERFLSLALKLDLDLLKKKEIKKILKMPFSQKIVGELEKYGKNVKISEFISNIPPELRNKFSDFILNEVEDVENSQEKLNKELANVGREIKILDTKERLEFVGSKIRKYEDLADKTNLKKTEKRFSMLSNRLSKLKKES